MYNWCDFKLPQAIELHAEGASLMLFKTSPSSFMDHFHAFYTHWKSGLWKKNPPSFLCRHVYFTYWNVLRDGVPLLRGILKLNHYTSRVINAVDFTFVSVYQSENYKFSIWFKLKYCVFKCHKHMHTQALWIIIWQLNESVHFFSLLSLSVLVANFYHQAKKCFILGPQKKHSQRNEQWAIQCYTR